MPLLMEGLRGPPTNMTPDDFAAAMQEVLDESAALDDVKKVTTGAILQFIAKMHSRQEWRHAAQLHKQITFVQSIT